jgi:hypothetical protein
MAAARFGQKTHAIVPFNTCFHAGFSKKYADVILILVQGNNEFHKLLITGAFAWLIALQWLQRCVSKWNGSLEE